MKLQIESLFSSFNNLQRLHGDKNLSAIYGAGCIRNPDLMMVFMNPTAKNISASKDWAGIHAPWLGTKNIWRIFTEIGRLSKITYLKTQKFKASGWTEKFCEQLYSDISKNKVYITNFSKTTQADARHLPNKHYREYLDLLKKEIEKVKPKKILSFGNQISSILLSRQVKVSEFEANFELLILPGDKKVEIYPVYYPVGQGMRNMQKSISLIKKIMSYGG